MLKTSIPSAVLPAVEYVSKKEELVAMRRRFLHAEPPESRRPMCFEYPKRSSHMDRLHAPRRVHPARPPLHRGTARAQKQEAARGGLWRAPRPHPGGHRDRLAAPRPRLDRPVPGIELVRHTRNQF